MKFESQLPRLIALALLVLFVLLASTGAFSRSASASQPVSPSLRY